MPKSEDVISSIENPKYKEIKSLLKSSGINKHNRMLIAGTKIIKEVLQQEKYTDLEFILVDDFPKNIINYFPENIIKKQLNIITLKKALFNEIDVFNTNTPLLTARLPRLSFWNYKTKPGCTLILPFQNPINMGAAIRSAVGMNVMRIVILKDAANPFHPKAIRASAGAVFKAELLNGPLYSELISRCKSLDNLITLDMAGINIRKYSFPADFLLLPGVEGQGLPHKIRAKAISIPMNNNIESFNAAVSVSLVLWEWKNKAL